MPKKKNNNNKEGASGPSPVVQNPVGNNAWSGGDRGRGSQPSQANNNQNQGRGNQGGGSNNSRPGGFNQGNNNQPQSRGRGVNESRPAGLNNQSQGRGRGFQGNPANNQQGRGRGYQGNQANNNQYPGGGRGRGNQGDQRNYPQATGGPRNNNFQSRGNFDSRGGDTRKVMDDALELPIIKKKSHDFSNISSLPKRPDRGNVDDPPVRIDTNCWDLSFKCITIYMYNVEFTDATVVESKKKLTITNKDKKFYIGKISSEYEKCVDDGGSLLLSLTKLPDITEASKTDTREVTDTSLRQIKLTFKILLASIISLDELLQFVDRNNTHASTLNLPQNAIRVLDTFFRYICSNGLVNTRSNSFFDPKPKHKEPRFLFTVHRGYTTSIRPQWKVRLNVDMICKAFFMTGKLSDVLYEKYSERMYDSRNWRFMTNDIRGLRVSASHFKSKGVSYSRKFTCHDISQKSAKDLIIPDLNISIEKYFAQEYGKKLEYPELPCVKVNKEKDTFIPMELLDVEPFQEPKCQQSDVSATVVRQAAIKPIERFNLLDEFVMGIVKSFSKPKVQPFEFKKGEKKVPIEGRLLPYPKFKDSQPRFNKGGWMQGRFEKPALNGSTIKWTVFHVDGDGSTHGSVVQQVLQEGRKLGMNFHDKPESKKLAPAQLTRAINEEKNKGTNLIMCIMYRLFGYPEIKKECDLQTGICTQCVKEKTVRKGNAFGNILLKVNAKLGGLNWSIASMQPTKEHIMVFGMDVTHPSPQSRNVEKSIYAIVGSMSKNLMRYGSIVGQQDTSRRGNNAIVEVIGNLDKAIEDLIKDNIKANGGTFPNRLIFYRDGVSEGQFKDVLIKELTSVQRACRSIKPDYEPAITYIVVQKRHHLRFIVDRDNVQPGTVIDTEVVNPRDYDFYLCSHYGLQGTSKAAHYYVLYDDSDWGSTSLQRFTFCLCFAYMRCSKAVSIPAPTYYSHLAAFRARDWNKARGGVRDVIENNRFKLHKEKEGWMYFL